jgi:hypothetical protein
MTTRAPTVLVRGQLVVATDASMLDGGGLGAAGGHPLGNPVLRISALFGLPSEYVGCHIYCTILIPFV